MRFAGISSGFICFFEQKYLSLQNTSKYELQDMQRYHVFPSAQSAHSSTWSWEVTRFLCPFSLLVNWKQENNFSYCNILGSKCYVMVACKWNVNKCNALFVSVSLNKSKLCFFSHKEDRNGSLQLILDIPCV